MLAIELASQIDAAASPGPRGELFGRLLASIDIGNGGKARILADEVRAGGTMDPAA